MGLEKSRWLFPNDSHFKLKGDRIMLSNTLVLNSQFSILNRRNSYFRNFASTLRSPSWTWMGSAKVNASGRMRYPL